MRSTTIAARVQWVDAADAPAALAAADMVFEGVPETLAAKREALAEIGRHCRADAIVTSTTSSILVTQLAPLIAQPERFLNLHWLNPAYLIPVVELSVHPGTSADVVERTRAAMTAIGKLPVVCGVAPGYIVPRLQALVMNEAARMIEEGVASAEEIDRATRYGLGLRFAAIGVVEFIDFGGADILHHASREMAGSIDAGALRRAAGDRPDDGRRPARPEERRTASTTTAAATSAPTAATCSRRTLAQVRERRPVASRRPRTRCRDDRRRPPRLRRRGARPDALRRVRRRRRDDARRSCCCTRRRAAGASTPRCCRCSARAGARSPSTPPASASPIRCADAEHRGLGRGRARSCSTRSAIGRAHVVGHHTGGVIAVELAARAPERVASLMLSSTPYTDAAFRRARAERPPIDAVDAERRRQPPRRALAEAPAVLSAGPARAAAGLRRRRAEGERRRRGRPSRGRLVPHGRADRRACARRCCSLHASDDPFAAPHLGRVAPPAARQRRSTTIAGGVPLPDQCPREFAAAVLAFVDALP